MNTTMAYVLLSRVLDLHGPHKSLVDYLNTFWHSLGVTVNEVCSFFNIAERPRVGSCMGSWLGNRWSNTVGFLLG